MSVTCIYIFRVKTASENKPILFLVSFLYLHVNVKYSNLYKKAENAKIVFNLVPVVRQKLFEMTTEMWKILIAFIY